MAQKSTALARADKPKALIEQNVDTIKSLLPRHVNADRFVKSAIMAVYNNPELQACSPESIVQATYTAAELGLDFIEAKGHAYMVPFGKTAKFMAGWRGKIDLATRNGIVKRIDAHLIYEKDDFKITYGTEPELKHAPFLGGDRGAIVGAYAIAFFNDGSCTIEFMTYDELKKVQSYSKMKDGPAYKNWASEMHRKAPIHRIFKRLPINPDKEEIMSKLMESENELYDLDGMPDAPPLIDPNGNGNGHKDLDPEKELTTVAGEEKANTEKAPKQTTAFDDDII